ncbi:hypothetical protein HY639_02050 [Candidatus Woesearchaeota archaeon]|nr:hypothetical protein [Candidatus Woesearchaeota archaeon]
MGLAKNVLKIGLLYTAGVIGTCAVVNYAASGVERKRDETIITKSELPWVYVAYRHYPTWDMMSIARPFRGYVQVVDSNGDAVPDRVWTRQGTYNRSEKDTEHLFKKVDELWHQYRTSMDVERIISDKTPLPDPERAL